MDDELIFQTIFVSLGGISGDRGVDNQHHLFSSLFEFFISSNISIPTRFDVKCSYMLFDFDYTTNSTGYRRLTEKSMLAFSFVYQHYANDCQWFVKADDDTYLIVDHLKLFLSKQKFSEPVTFGFTFNVIDVDHIREVELNFDIIF